VQSIFGMLSNYSIKILYIRFQFFNIHNAMQRQRLYSWCGDTASDCTENYHQSHTHTHTHGAMLSNYRMSRIREPINFQNTVEW